MNAPPRGHARSLELGIGCLLVIAVLAAFWPALGADFVNLDDDQNLLQNPSYRGLGGTQLGWMFTTAHMGHYQPLTWVSFAVDHARAGMEPGAYHLSSVLLHALVAVAVFALFRRLLSLRFPRELATPTAGMAAGLFALHPLRAESVAWVTGRNDLISGLFAVLCLLAWLRHVREVPEPEARAPRLAAATGLGLALLAWVLLRLELTTETGPRLAGLSGFELVALAAGFLVLLELARGRGGWAWRLAVLCFLLSLGGKASAMALPLVLLLLDAWPLGRAHWEEGERRARIAGLLLEKLPLFVLSGLFAFVGALAKSGPGSGMRSLAEHGPVERLLQATYGLGFYPWKTLVPTGLLPIYELPARVELSDPRFLVPFVLVIAVTIALVFLRRRWPALLVSWLAFAILVSPGLGLLQAGAQLVADRYSYLACLPFALLAGAGLVLLAQRPGESHRGVWIGAALLVTIYAVQTGREAARWTSSERLYARGVALGTSPQLLTNLAMVRNQQAAEFPNQRPLLLQQALEQSQRAHAIAAERDLARPVLWLHRGTILYNLQRHEEAAADLRHFLELSPDDLQGRLNLGLALNGAGRFDEALEHFERSLEFEPTLTVAWRGLGLAREGSGDPDGARAAYLEAERLQPGHPLVRSRLEVLGTRD